MKAVSLSKWLILIIPILITFQSCEKDSVDDLYTQDNGYVSFSQSINPIIESNCKSCHSGSAPSAGIALDSYTSIKAAADNGSLMGTIRHESGWSPMPKNANKLRDDDIRKLEKWIEKGSPNN
jgi:mono/diheme cytochrome c family protein